MPGIHLSLHLVPVPCFVFRLPLQIFNKPPHLLRTSTAPPPHPAVQRNNGGYAVDIAVAVIEDMVVLASLAIWGSHPVWK